MINKYFEYIKIIWLRWTVNILEIIHKSQYDQIDLYPLHYIFLYPVHPIA